LLFSCRIQSDFDGLMLHCFYLCLALYTFLIKLLGSPGFMVYAVSSTTVRDSVMLSESRICGLLITSKSGEPITPSSWQILRLIDRIKFAWGSPSIPTLTQRVQRGAYRSLKPTQKLKDGIS
jgi:hypothetical protein